MRSDGQRNRERIIATAREVLKADGAAVSMEHIARSAQVSSATLRRNFQTRQSLLEAVYHDEVTQLCRRGEVLADSDDAGAALASWLEQVSMHTAGSQGLAGAILQTPSASLADEDTCHGLMRDVTAQLLRRVAVEGLAEPEITVDDLLSVANGLALASEGAPRTARRLVRLAVGGIFHPSGRS